MTMAASAARARAPRGAHRARRSRPLCRRRTPRPGLSPTYYAMAADVCVRPLQLTESFGLVALEAQALGTPVVAASVGGLREVVDDGVTGFLVEGHHPEDYARAVADVLDDPVRKAEMGEEARRRAGRFTWLRAVDRLAAIYDAAYHQRRGPAVRQPVRLRRRRRPRADDCRSRLTLSQRLGHPTGAKKARKSPTGPRWASLSGLTIERTPVISSPAISRASTPTALLPVANERSGSAIDLRALQRRAR